MTATVSAVTGGAGVRKYSLDWTSDASGDVSGNSVTLPAGTIVAVTFTPDSGGTQPTDQYDVTMTCDQHGVNVLDNGAGTSIGANLSNAAATHKIAFIGAADTTYIRQWLHGGGYTLVVAAAGSAKGGLVDVYIAPGVL
ncbi:hypothetical protein [Streptomyces alboflavus]|uniref:hypothetical protein n=1 Tax=Streptomyces alboflavus TaxID=67267 RepID=UPI0012FEB15A|nr:hypothetical protein [Streptomyces alboflavus]